MRRARYRGRKPRGTLSDTQVCAVCLLLLAALAAMTIGAASRWSGRPAHELLYEAVFETEDWA